MVRELEIGDIVRNTQTGELILLWLQRVNPLDETISCRVYDETGQCEKGILRVTKEVIQVAYENGQLELVENPNDIGLVGLPIQPLQREVEPIQEC